MAFEIKRYTSNGWQKIVLNQTSISGLTEALSNKANLSDIPTKTSQLTNNSGYINNIIAVAGSDINSVGTPSVDVLNNNKLVFHQLKGEPGKKGEPGRNGEDGIPGPDGITPHIDSASGNWFIEEHDTEVPATGPQGPRGDNNVHMQYNSKTKTLTINYYGE